MAYLDTKEHKDWRKRLIERDKGCVICGQKAKIAAHHLIPKEYEEYRSDINNGVMLCFKHHMKYGFYISPHSHGAMLFAIWLLNNRKEQFKWVEEHWDGEE